MGGIASIFTPQNTYSASAGVNNGNQDMQGLLAGTQANTAQNNANQSSLAQQLLAQSQGSGPNPAQQMLNQATTQNQQQAAGQMASQKGINPGLAQKQIMGASANQAQQGAGQGALMGAQQQIAAQGQLGSLYNNMATQNLSNQGQYEASLTGQNNTNAGVAAQNAAANQNTSAGMFNAAGGGGLSAMGLYKGGSVPRIQKFDDGGGVLGADIGQADPTTFGSGISSGMSTLDGSAGADTTPGGVDQFGSGISEGMAPLDGKSTFNWKAGLNSAVGGLGGGAGSNASSSIAQQIAGMTVPSWAAGNAKTKDPGTSGSQGLGSLLSFLSQGGSVSHPLPVDHPVIQALHAMGGPVPGQPIVNKNSPVNDVQPAMLTPKEIVLPLHVTQSKDPGEAAKSFVEQIKNKKSSDKGSYANVLAAKRKASK